MCDVTTTFHLVRHGLHALVEHVLVGRGDVPLSAEGWRQAGLLADEFVHAGVAAVFSSPRARTAATANAIAERLGTTAIAEPAIDEVDLGTWSGRSFAELGGDPEWRRWCLWRNTTHAPGGESMISVQLRTLGWLGRMRLRYPGQALVIVSHLDVIRSAILHYLGLSLNQYGRIDIAPGTISTLIVGDWGCKVLRLGASRLT